jgi:hypothetical protein
MEQAQGGTLVPIIIYGGLSGRLDQTTSVLSLLHKLRRRTNTSTTVPTEPVHPSAEVPTDAEAHDRTGQGSVKLPTGEAMYISYNDIDTSKSGRRHARAVGKRDIRVVNDDCIAWVLDSVSAS